MTVDISKEAVTALWKDVSAFGLKHHSALYVADVLATLSARLAEAERERDIARYLDKMNNGVCDINDVLRSEIASLSALLDKAAGALSCAQAPLRKFARMYDEREYTCSQGALMQAKSELSRAAAVLAEIEAFRSQQPAPPPPAS